MPDCILASREWPGLSCCWLLWDSASGPSVEVMTLRAVLANNATTCGDPTCSQQALYVPDPSHQAAEHDSDMHGAASQGDSYGHWRFECSVA